MTGLLKDRLLGCIDFTAGSLARKGARSRIRETGNKVSSDKDLTGGWEDGSR